MRLLHSSIAAFALVNFGNCAYLLVNGTKHDVPKQITIFLPVTRKAMTMSLFDNIRTWNRVRQTRNELFSLSNRELDDLGITRGDIPFIAKQASRGL